MMTKKKNQTIGHEGLILDGIRVPNYRLLPKEEAEHWEHLLYRTSNDCGCRVGTVSAVLSTLAYAVLVEMGVINPNVGVAVPLGIAVFLLGAVGGKLIGLKLAQLRMKSLIRELTGRMIAHQLSPQRP